MRKGATILFLLLGTFNFLFANGDDPIVTLCSGKKMTWNEYLLTKEMLSYEYDIEIDYISANNDFISFSPAMVNNAQGAWSSVIDMPLVAASIANLPDGKVLLWSAKDKLSFGGNLGRTWTAIYDPSNNTISEFLIDETNHDMFCPGVSTLPDGSVMVTGGSSSNKASIYNPYTEQWNTGEEMNIPRGYHSNVTLSSGATFVIGGSWSGGVGNKHAEVWSEKSGWFKLPNVPVEAITDGTNSSQNSNKDDYFAWLWAAPNGKLFHAGPSQTMHWIDTEGVGSWTSAGQRGDDPYSASGTTVMYDIGKILKAGGAPTSGEGGNANNRAYTIDINTDDPVVTRVGDLAYSRNVHNSVVLPTGEVLVLGGIPKGNFFSDVNSRLYAELWDPQTGEWTTMAEMTVPRNYHSSAILMNDGRVMTAGGGLCGGCAENHPDAQIFSPPYLFNTDGSLATRPVITSAPDAAAYNSAITVNTDVSISSFAVVRLSGATHSTNNDQRRIPLTFTANGTNQYQLSIPNRNILPPGRYMLFAMNSNGTPSIATSIKIGDDINDCTPQTNPDLGGSGLVGKYYNNTNFTNLANEQLDPTVNFNYGTGSPASNMEGNTFSIRWEGSIKVPREGAYTFYTNSDDGVRLWVDGKQMIDNWTLHGPTEDIGMVVLEPGQEYPIKLEYYENSGGAVIQLSWSAPGIEKQIIPEEYLSPFYFGVDQNTRIGNGAWIPGNEVTICEGETAYFDYTGSFSNDWSFKYIRPDGQWNIVNPDSDNLGIDVLKIGPPTSTDNHPNEGTWTVEITNPDGYTITQYFTINISPGPEFECEFNIDNTGWFVESDCTIEICEGQALNFSSPGCDDDWQIEVTGPNGYDEIEIGGCHNFIISNIAAANIAGLYTAVLTQLSTGCSTTKEFTVVVDSNPEVLCYFDTGNGWEQVCEKTVCTGNPVTLSAHPAVNGNTWSWSGPNGFSASTRTVILTSDATETLSGEYIVTYTNENGCTGTNILPLTVDSDCIYCPTVGEACDDNDDCTINDIYDEDCNCIGTFQDSDNDGVCDADDICAGGDDNVDIDNDGIPDACDDCTTVGQACNDNDPCTVNDVYDADCNCAGIIQDSDNDGVCDAEDICAGGDDNVDVDNDGIPDACDDCTTVGQGCDDNDSCTINDIYDENCNCVGTVQDSDNDGVCDAEDICAGGDDNIDSDGDGTPDFCEEDNPTVVLSTASLEVTEQFELVIDISATVTGLSIDDFTISNGTVLTDLSVVGTTYYVSVAPTNPGLVSIQLPANSVLDVNDNGNLISNVLEVNYSPVIQDDPAVVLSTASLEVTEQFELVIDISTAVTGLSIDDFTISNGTILTDLSSVGTTYYVSVTPTSPGVVSIQLPANSVSDVNGNGNLISNLLEVNYSPIGGNPTVVLSTASLEVTEQFELVIDISKFVTGLSIDDFTISNGTILSDLSNVGTAYYVSVTPTSPGIISIQLPANSVLDANGNGNLASNLLEVNYNPIDENPTVILSTASLEVTEQFELVIDISKIVTGLSIDDFTISNGTILTDLSNVGTAYYVSVAPTSPGIVSIQLPANSVSTASGSGNLASNILEVNYSPEMAKVEIVNPSEGEELMGTELVFNFLLSGDLDAYDAQYLILTLDDDVPVILADLTNGVRTYTFTDVEVGAHTLVAQLADEDQEPLDFLEAEDLVNFTTVEDPNGGIDCSSATNVALNGTASLSSDYGGGGGEAELAIDGNTNGDWFTDFSIASTGWEVQPYWELDLGGSFNIEDINIWNRTDCCADALSDYYVLVSEQPFVSDDLNTVLAQAGVVSLQQSETAGTPSTIPVGLSGRFIRIQSNATGFITLAEVEVMGCPITNNNSGNMQSAYILPQTESKGIDAILYPNPVDKYLFIKYEVAREGNMRYFISDARGIIHHEAQQQVSSGNDIMFMNIADLPPGYYVFYLQVDGYKYIELPFIKIRD